MIVQHNMSAMNATRQLKISGGALQKNTEKLSSGYRINRAGDDAAGLSISEKMRAQIRGLDRASTNSQDGISLIQTAEGALNETHSILQRMRELAVQAASDTNTDPDRQKIQDEINQLTNEVDRIANTTEFNTKKLLNGDQKGATDGYAGTVSVDGNFVNGNVSVSVEGDVNTNISDVIRFTVKELGGGTNVDKGDIRIQTETLFGTESDDPNFKLSHDVTPKADGSKLTIADSETGYTLTLDLDNPSVANSYEASFKEDGTLDIKIVGKNGAADKTYNLNLVTGKAIDENGKEANNFNVNGSSISFIDGDGTSQTINVTASATDKDGNAVDGVTFNDGVADVNGTKITTGGVVTPSQGTESRLGVTTNPTGGLRIVDTTTGSVIDISAGTITDTAGTGFAGAGTVVGKGVYKFTGTDMDLYVDTVNNKAYVAPTNGGTVSLASAGALSGNPIPSNAKLLDSNALKITQTASGASVSVDFTGLKITSSSGTVTPLAGEVTFNLSVSVTNPKGNYTASINSQGQIELKDGDGKTSVIAQNGEVVSRPSSSNSSSSSSNVQTYDGTFKASGSNAKGTISFGGGYSVKISGGKAVLIQDSVEIGSGSISNGKVSFTKPDGTKITLNAAMSGSNFKATGHKLEVQTSAQSATSANAVGYGVPASPGNPAVALANNVAVPTNVVNPENPNAAASKDADVEARSKTKANATEGWTDVTIKDNKITFKFGGATVTIDNADKLKVGDTVTLKITGKEDAIGADDINKDGVKLQIGANAGQEMQMRIASMKASALDIANSDGEALDVTKQSHASLAIEAYDMAIQKVSRERAKMGAIQNRLEHTIANLDTASENLQSAESRIRDTDMAKEMTAYSKNNILTQAGQSMLAQANQQTQGVLTLLR